VAAARLWLPLGQCASFGAGARICPERRPPVAVAARREQKRRQQQGEAEEAAASRALARGHN